MTDIFSTNNSTIWDEDGDYAVGVTSDGKLKVDAEVTAEITWDDANGVQVGDGTNFAGIEQDAIGNHRLKTTAITTDALYVAGLTESFSDSLTLSFGSPEGVNAWEVNLKTLGENSCPSVLYPAATINSTNDVLQVFRASANSYAGCGLFASLAGDTSLEIDDFDTNVTNNWRESTWFMIASADTSIKYEGTSSMRLRTRKQATNAYAQRTYGTAQDYSSYDEISFWYYNTNTDLRWVIELEDSSGEYLQSGQFGAGNAGTWENKTLSFASFSEEGTGTTDLSDIREIRFRCMNTDNGTYYSYFDLLQVIGVSDGEQIEVELYDFGTTANPTNISDGTLLNDDNGASSTVMNITGTSPNRYTNTFLRGVNNSANELTVGNYYGIRYKSTGTIYFFGSNTQVYTSGKTFMELTSTGAFTDTTKSMAFQQFYAPESAYVVGMAAFFNAKPLTTEFNMGIKKYGEVNANDQILCGLKFYDETKFTAPFARPEEFSKGDRFIIITDKDGGSDMTQANLFVQAFTTPLTRYN